MIVNMEPRVLHIVWAEVTDRKISDCIALLLAESTTTIDSDFAKDVEAAIAAHREPLGAKRGAGNLAAAAFSGGPEHVLSRSNAGLNPAAARIGCPTKLTQLFPDRP